MHAALEELHRSEKLISDAVPMERVVRLRDHAGSVQRFLQEVCSGAADNVEWYHADRLGVRLIATSTTGTKEQVTLPFGTPLASESTGSTSYSFASYDRSSSLSSLRPSIAITGAH